MMMMIIILVMMMIPMMMILMLLWLWLLLLLWRSIARRGQVNLLDESLHAPLDYRRGEKLSEAGALVWRLAYHGRKEFLKACSRREGRVSGRRQLWASA